MSVRHFLSSLRTARVVERAEATAALARTYLYSDLTPDDRAATEGALIMLLDDPSPIVRAELARALAFSEEAPPSVILALANDQPQVAACVLEHSPLLLDADLVDAVATNGQQVQAAIANRGNLPCAVSAAIAEVGSAEACLVLLENTTATIAPFSLDRMVNRFGHLAAIREAMLVRDNVPATTRQALVAALSRMLAGFVTARAWLGQERAQRVTKEACEKATVTLAGVSPENEIRPLVRHLRESGQLNAGLMLRALLSGNVDLFEEALAELSGMRLERVSALVHDKGSSGLHAVFHRAALPPSTYPAFREAVEAMREGGFASGGSSHLKRRIVERVLTRCADNSDVEVEPLLTLLRRFAAEAAREEARFLCKDLLGDEPQDEHEQEQRYAA